jgi:hypothetical protein
MEKEKLDSIIEDTNDKPWSSTVDGAGKNGCNVTVYVSATIWSVPSIVE